MASFGDSADGSAAESCASGRPRRCIDDGGGGQRGDLGAARVGEGAAAIGMQPAGQDDDERLGLGVDPETRAGEAGMAEAATARTASRAASCNWSRRPSPAPGAGPRGVAAASIMARTASGERTRRPLGPSPPFKSVCAKMARSSAVANNPAWPATPPSARARGSWTMPRSIAAVPVLQRSVGAIRSTRYAPATADWTGRKCGVRHPERLEDPFPGEGVEVAGRSCVRRACPGS